MLYERIPLYQPKAPTPLRKRKRERRKIKAEWFQRRNRSERPQRRSVKKQCVPPRPTEASATRPENHFTATRSLPRRQERGSHLALRCTHALAVSRRQMSAEASRRGIPLRPPPGVAAHKGSGSRLAGSAVRDPASPLLRYSALLGGRDEEEVGRYASPPVMKPP